MADPQTARRTFAPIVLLGLASAGLAALAGTKEWVAGSSGTDPSPGVAATASGTVASSPLGTALALVVLACWGVLLVTRGRFRRLIAALAALAAFGYAAVVAAAPFTLPDHLVEEVLRQTGAELDDTDLTVWFAVAVAASVLVAASTLLAVRFVHDWPEMGTKYDAPAGARAENAPAQPTENIDIWKALDEGRDPTA